MNDFIQAFPCQNCDSNSGDCREITDNLDMILCVDAFGEADAAPGWKYNGRCKKNDRWGELVKDDRDWTEEQRDKANLERAARKVAREKAKLERLGRSLSAEERDPLYREILSQLTLTKEDRADLVGKRGLTEEHVRRGMFVSTSRKKLKSKINPALPGISADGMSIVWSSPGYLCPLPDVYGNIVALQVRKRELKAYENGKLEGRYCWLSRSGEGSPVLELPNGENPLSVFRPEGIKTSLVVGLAEGVGVKPLLTADRLDMPVIGAAGGQWMSSPETLRASLEELGATTIILFPDSGMLNNKDVMRRYEKALRLLEDWGYPAQVAWWGQIEKGFDIDEIDQDRLEAIEYISVSQFLAMDVKEKDDDAAEDIQSAVGEKLNVQPKPSKGIGFDKDLTSKKLTIKQLADEIRILLARNLSNVDLRIERASLLNQCDIDRLEFNNLWKSVEESLETKEAQRDLGSKLKSLLRNSEFERMDIEAGLWGGNGALAKAIRARAASMPTAPEFILSTLIPAAASRIGTVSTLIVKPSFKVRPIFRTLIVGRSGQLKSPAQEVVTTPLETMEGIANEEYKVQLAAHEKAVRNQAKSKKPRVDDHEKAVRKQAARKQAKSKKPQVDVEDLIPPVEKPQLELELEDLVPPVKKPQVEAEDEDLVPPVRKRYIIKDDTPAARIDSHVDNPRGLLLYKDEGSAFVTARGQFSKNGDGGEFEADLSEFSGQAIISDRRTSGNKMVPKSGISRTGSTQYGTLAKLMGDHLDICGEWARYLFCAVDAPLALIDLFQDLGDDFDDLFVRLIRGLDNLEPDEYRLSDDAKASCQDFLNQLVRWEQQEDHPALQVALPKFRTYFLRFILWMHVINAVLDKEAPEPFVDIRCVKAAEQWTKFFIRQFQTVMMLNSPQQKLEGDYLKALNYIKRKCASLEERKESDVIGVSLRDVYRSNCLNYYVDKKQKNPPKSHYTEVLSYLVEEGYLKEVDSEIYCLAGTDGHDGYETGADGYDTRQPQNLINKGLQSSSSSSNGCNTISSSISSNSTPETETETDSDSLADQNNKHINKGGDASTPDKSAQILTTIELQATGKHPPAPFSTRQHHSIPADVPASLNGHSSNSNGKASVAPLASADASALDLEDPDDPNDPESWAVIEYPDGEGFWEPDMFDDEEEAPAYFLGDGRPADIGSLVGKLGKTGWRGEILKINETHAEVCWELEKSHSNMRLSDLKGIVS